MKIAIDGIKVMARIRKQTTKIEELASDISKNGLLNPITVMESVGGAYQLLAGLRRLRAAQSLGWTDIDVNIVAPKDAEAALGIEYAENIQREPFTFSEKMDYARLIEEIEQAKAKERMLSGKKSDDPTDRGPKGGKRETRDIVGGKIGMSGRQYDRAKYVAEHAPSSVIDELDSGGRTIRKTYDDLRRPEKQLPNVDASGHTEPFVASGKTLPPTAPAVPARESDLDRAIRAESELDAYKYRQHNEIYHRDSIIDNLKRRVAELEAALEAAYARIRELGGTTQ